jgi:hypothetical protein
MPRDYGGDVFLRQLGEAGAPDRLHKAGSPVVKDDSRLILVPTR